MDLNNKSDDLKDFLLGCKLSQFQADLAFLELIEIREFTKNICEVNEKKKFLKEDDEFSVSYTSIDNWKIKLSNEYLEQQHQTSGQYFEKYFCFVSNNGHYSKGMASDPFGGPPLGSGSDSLGAELYQRLHNFNLRCRGFIMVKYEDSLDKKETSHIFVKSAGKSRHAVKFDGPEPRIVQTKKH